MRSRISLERALLLVLVACAFVLSWAALTAVARGAGFGDLSVLLAVVVDGFAIISARSLERLDGRGPRAYSWTLLVGLVAFSVWLNTEHAHLVPVPGLDLTEGQAQLIAGSVPVILAAAFHLTILIQRADERRAPALGEASPTTGTPQAANGPESPSAAAQEAVPAPVQPVAEPSEGSRADARLWFQSVTPQPTPFELSQAAGVPVTTASRWIEEWKTDDDDVEAHDDVEEEPARRAGRVQFH